MTTSETRHKLICATEHLLRTNGLARITTREIAREACVAEGALYHHFSDKAELLHAVVLHIMGDYREALENLPLQVGQRTVHENLEHTLQTAFDFQFKLVPITCSLFADHELLSRIREIINERCTGPSRAVDALAAYLQAEQRLGRVNANVAAQSAAELLLGGTFHAAMLDQLLARKVSRAAARQRLHETVHTLLSGLEPRVSAARSVTEDRNVE